jgi:hypothetical protein
VGADWFDTLQAKAVEAGACGASGLRKPGSDKIAGFAFILDTTSGVRPDERMRWWYSDDAIQKRCEARSGFVVDPNTTVEHRYPSRSTTGALRQVSRQDRALFRRVYR